MTGTKYFLIKKLHLVSNLYKNWTVNKRKSELLPLNNSYIYSVILIFSLLKFWSCWSIENVSDENRHFVEN